MSKLLLDEHPIMVMPQLAKKIGLNESMFLQQVHYWNELNKRSNNNYKDGHYWTFNSIEKWQEQFPFWGKRTIQRTITNLEKLELLITSNYNKLKIDRTKWYRIDYEALETLENSPFSQIGTKNTTEWLEHLHKMTSPLPETNPENNTENNYNKGDEQGSPLSHQNISLNVEEKEVIDYYMSVYKQRRNEEHPRLKENQWNYVKDNLFYVVDPNTFVDFDLSNKDLHTMIDKHFETNYKNCDYNILHFMSDGVRINRMYEVAY